ncbi:MAG: hypothetical protein LN413_03855 [Candidatus Thermoplasmatota archaeon]|nr:hypothetical protein [Candidatus Thermoplasmatota archaeon]
MCPVLTAETTQVSYGRQASFGTAATAVGSNRWPGPATQVEGIFPDIDWKEVWVRGGSRDVFQYVQGKRVLEGTIRFHAQESSLMLLQHAFGKMTTTGSADPWTHTIEGAGVAEVHTPGPPITLRRGYQVNATQEVAFYVRDNIVNTMEISGAEEDLVEVALGVQAGKPDPGRATETIMSVTQDTSQIYSFKDTSTNLTLDSVAEARLKSFRFSIDNTGKMAQYYQNTDPDYPFEYIPARRRYVLEASVVPIDDTFLAKLDAASPITTATFDFKLTVQAAPEHSLQIKGDVAGASGVWKSAPYDIPEEAEIVVPITMWVSKAQLIVLDDNADTVWTAAP